MQLEQVVEGEEDTQQVHQDPQEVQDVVPEEEDVVPAAEDETCEAYLVGVLALNIDSK